MNKTIQVVQSQLRRTILLSAVMFICVIAGVACSSSSDTNDDVLGGDVGVDRDADEDVADVADPDDVSDTDVEEEPLPRICEPGEVQGCRVENSPSVDVCNGDGTKIVPGSCGESQVCREGQCVNVGCVPGTRRCANTTQPQECDEDGNNFVEIEACEEGTRCDEGYCLDACAIAKVMNSYIGCEYWAVELENHLLNRASDGSAALPPDRRPPFAIVLANTSETSPAEITVELADGSFAQALPQRLVGTDYQLPGLDLVTVYSEVLNERGERVYGPIEGDIHNLPLPPKSIMTLVLPHHSIPFGSSSLTDVAYRVSSTYPVVAYQFNPLCCNYNYTNDASLLLPTGVLTGNYMFMSFEVWRSGSGLVLPPTLTVVATEPDTEVQVELPPSKASNRSFRDMIYPITSQRVSGPGNSGVIEVTMQPFEVLNIAGSGSGPNEDLTGARIRASKPVAVFGGHSCTNVPFSVAACDHLESQLFPMETWGNRFVAAPLKMRGESNQSGSREGTYWKFLARQDRTRIATGLNLNPPHVLGSAGGGVPFCGDLSTNPESGVFHLDAGQTCELGTKKMFVVESTQPIMLGAFLSGQLSVSGNTDWGTHSGDPAFFLVPPQEQYRSAYSFLTPATYWVSYVTVTMQPGFKITLDDKEVDLMDFDHEVLEGGGMIMAHIPVEDGPHTISAIVPFGIVVYGYDDFVSYAYTGGLDLKKLSDVD